MRSLIIQTTLFVHVICDVTISNYYTKRAQIVKNESLRTLGGNITLSDKENFVNNCLMGYKCQEIDYAFDNPQYFNLSHHYFTYKEKLRNSKVYKVIQKMPKGAALHIHDMALLGPDYLMKITYEDHLYVCLGEKFSLTFSNSTPQQPCERWQLMSEARYSAKNVTEFDIELRKRFTLVVKDPEVIYPSIKETWTAFMNYFTTVAPMLTYRPVWEQYFYDALLKFREDNIMYVEVRSILPNLYELDGTVYDSLITAKAYRKAINRFVKDYPDFFGAKLIYAPSRNVNKDELEIYLQSAKKIKRDMPDIFAGFDLVGQEDLGKPLIDFIPQLISATDDLNFFFHAGETDWYGTLTDENLVDAILLGAKRIGHAYALPKHPLLLKEVIDNNVGIEVNIISNTILSLVRDVRNHPLSAFLANCLPVVLSSDDPGAWEAEPLSDDFYVAFVGAASRPSDLRMLKTLALNSLKYSALEPLRKAEAINKFNLQWTKYIDEFNCSEF